MPLQRKPFFFDAQLSRMLVQVMSCFSGYQTMTGTQRDGKPRFRDVPIIYGDMSRTLAYMVNSGSENTMSYLPMMSLYMTSLRQSSERRLNPQHVEKYNYVERARDPDGNLLIGQPGKKKTIERYMPVPYEMGVKLTIWSSNNNEGYQLIEQIATVFNPAMEIQLSNSPADWAFLTNLHFDGEFEFEKAVPSSDTDPMYIYGMNFNTIVYMSPPAKVYETKHIYSIHVPIKELEETLDFDSMTQLDGLVIKADEDDTFFFEMIGEEDTPGDV